ncbi:hypothetical protein HBI56_201080 [Parastagonospora nodorum]|uniref:Uncharacterized protein n=1 Tax=Phaeosphaeria nodorum (strain SN15 / ATCC MYA-4574 / FGSC 10173) TaxID=321614 RepID=A0A7U2HZK0_PHANO|nr:hypothetical protein HBH56_215630 [Parastagonospora nodorum]QRC93867.1 hypothetical protein JI435_404660 [Parastagonospora nodorum SN15]KAH3922627.1 hypothetical protein HBH54_221870 [Parastagonospora nodorum]KAH3942134.1 hypothetical protein HBH53_191780 [Parastagonospora nodorum]KAH3961403.1 hypothetical protein HBH51_184310 [Parastagonospora nodorum]
MHRVCHGGGTIRSMLELSISFCMTLRPGQHMPYLKVNGSMPRELPSPHMKWFLGHAFGLWHP